MADVIYTAIFGGKDKLLPPLCDVSCECICFTDRAEENQAPGWTTIQAGPLLTETMNDPLLTAKSYKLFPNLCLPQHVNKSIWIDGNYQIEKDPWDWWFKYFVQGDLIAAKHWERQCLYDEGNFCIAKGKDTKEAIASQMVRYSDRGYLHDAGLWACGVLGRRHTTEVAEFSRQWWSEILSGSVRDQISFPYVRAGLSMKVITPSREEAYFVKRVDHVS